MERQNPDGGWPWQQDGLSSVAVTHEVLLAARAARPASFWAEPPVSGGVAWLLGRQTDGGFGDLYPNVAQTALFLQLTEDQPVDQGAVQQAIDFLVAHQRGAGDWEASVYKTALAVGALAPFLLPDPYVEGGELFLQPDQPYDDQDLTFIVAVRNGGLPLAAGTQVRFEIAPAATPESPIEALGDSLPALGEIGFVTVEATLPAGNLVAGDYVLRFIIDPEREISEKDRENNVASLDFRVRSHPTGVDLVLGPGDIAAVPEEITSMPQSTSVDGVVRNAGLTGALGVVMAVYDGAPAAGLLLGTTVVDLPALGATPFSIPVSLDQPRPYVLTVVADPDDLAADVDRQNNRASTEALLRFVVDVDIAADGLTAVPGAVAVGEAVTLSAEVHNGGTVPLSDIPVVFTYDTGSEVFQIQALSVPGPLAPNASQRVEVVWQPNLAGDLTVAVELDPQAVLGDADPSDNIAQTLVTVTGSPLSNLRITPEAVALVPSPPLQGQNAEVRATIANGTVNAAGPFTAELWLDEIGGGVLLTSQAFAGLAAGSSVDLVATWNVLLPDDRLLYAILDTAGEVDEFDESDNQAFVVADVRTLPDLAVTSGGVTVTPDFPRVGDVLLFDVLVANQGDQPAPASLLELVAENGAVLDSVAVPPMAGHTELELSLSWDPATLPGGAQPGDFALTVRVNAAGAFPELASANNAAHFSVAVQNSELYVANQIFSPNGDGVQDVATFFFRNAAGAVEVVAGDGRVVRTLELEDGAESAVWDGRNDDGELLRDGLYQVRLGDLESWAVVDNNLYPITAELDQLLLVGFLEPRFPGDGEEFSRFESMISNPLVEEVYLVERYHAPSTPSSEDTYTLHRWSGDELIEIGPYPTDAEPLLAASTTGDTFIAGYQSSSGFELLRYPGPVRQDLTSPEGSGYDPWLSPDGRWLIWASDWREQVVVQSVASPGDVHVFDAGDFDGYGVCGYSIVFSTGNRVLVAVGTWSDLGYFYDIDLGAEPPTAVLVEGEGSLNCGDGGGGGVLQQPSPKSAADKLPGHGTEMPQIAGDFDRDELTWAVIGSSYSYTPSLEAGGEPEALRQGTEKDFLVVWDEQATGQGGGEPAGWQARFERGPARPEAFQVKGYYGGAATIEVVTLGLEEGERRHSASFGLDVPPWAPPYTSLSSDGFVVAYNDRYGGYGYDVTAGTGDDGAEKGEPAWRSHGLLPTSPELSLPAPRAPGADKGEGGGAGDQFLLRWDTAEERQLPFALERALWTPVDKFLIASLDAAYYTDELVPYFTPAANLTTRLRPRVLFGDAGVDLWVLATDRYLDYYLLEYLDLDAGGDYQSIGLPSDEPLYGERWGTWLPPGNGRYRLRLSARDRAGNVRQSSKRVVWNGDNDIANLYLEKRYISPRSSPGVQDQLIFHYTVLRPANLDFAITDENGVTVADLPVAADTTGPRTTTWDGTDNAGNPVPDGRYLLTYGEASWPLVVDNTPPQVSLRFEDTKLVIEKADENGNFDEDVLVAELFAAVRDDNLAEWRYETAASAAPDQWTTLAVDSQPLEQDDDVAWRIYGASDLVRRELRLVARDLAGNSSSTVRAQRDERLLFTDSEPPCRTDLEPCLYPERPTLPEIADSGGFLVGDDLVLQPFYDTLLVESTVWTDDLDLTLEYRETSLAGLPTGPWVEGLLQVADEPIRRTFCTLDVSTATPPEICSGVGDHLRAVYWDHPDLPLIPFEVRLRATNADGQEIVSEARRFQPEVPLIIEYLGIDQAGDHFRVTNASNGVVRDIDLAVRKVVFGAVVWEYRMDAVERLLPGQFAEVASGCVLVGDGNRLIRAQGVGSLAEDAVSLPVAIPPREGFSGLRSSFVRGSCGNNGGGYFGVEHQRPCDFPFGPPAWPQFWVTSGLPWGVLGRVALDPTGVAFSTYELLLDGNPVLQVDGPLQAADYQQTLDLTAFPAGNHSLSERYTYSGAPGLLGTCPRTFPVRIDRTPPIPTLTEPPHGSTICPADLMLDIAVEVEDDGPVNHTVRVGGLGTGNDACSPFSGPGGAFTLEANQLEFGLQEMVAEVKDQAGFASCTSIEVLVPNLPDIRLGTTPPIFSPTNTLGRPTVEEVLFTTGTPGTYQVRIADQTGADVVVQPEAATDGVQEHLLAWDGNGLGGVLQPDGEYQAIVRAVSPCGAEQTKAERFILDATPPEVALSSPLAGTVAGSSVEFIGRVRDPHFERFELQVLWLDGLGEWVTVKSDNFQTGDEPVSLGVWHTDGFPSGEYLLRVYAVDEPGNEAYSLETQIRIRDRRFIKRFEREPEIFSPNADGVLDQLKIKFELFQDALITLQVLDPEGEVAAILLDRQPRTGGPVHENLWGGALDLGGQAPDGLYGLRILAEDPVVPPELESEEENLSATVDKTKPVLAIINPVADSLAGLAIQVNGSLDELHPDRWTLDLRPPGADRVPIASGSGAFDSRQLYRLVDWPDGDYQLIYDALDLAGNSAQLTRNFRIDDTAPAVQIFAPTGGSVHNTLEDYLRLEGEVIEHNLVSYAWSYAPGGDPEAGDFLPIQQATSTLADGAVVYDWDASRLDDGLYTLRLSATDELLRTAEARLMLTVDNTPPEVMIDQPADGSVVSDTTDVLGSVDDATLRLWQLTLQPAGAPQIPLAAGAAAVDGTLTTWSVLPADGEYQLILSAEDAAGNEAETMVTVTVSVTPPEPPLLISADVVGQQDVALVWQPGGGPPPVAYNVYRDGVQINVGPVAGLSYNDAGLPEGVYTYTVRAITAAGSESADSNALEARINLSGPVAHISLPRDGSRISDLVDVIGTAYRQSGLAGWNLWLRQVGGAWALLGSGTAPVSADFLATWDTALPQYPDGPYQLKLEVDDVFGNRAVAQVAVEVDNTPPVAPVLTTAFALAADPDAEINDIHVEWTLDPVPADLAGFFLYRNGQLANAPGPVIGTQTPFLIDTTTYDDSDLPDGTYVYYVTAADSAENESAASNASDPIVIDTRRPHAVIVDPPDGSEFEDAVLLTAEVEDLDVVSVQFEVRADAEGVFSPLGPLLDRPPWVMQLAPATSGLYHVRAVAADGVGPDPAPESIALTETDLPPAGPADLELRVDGGDVFLTWTPVPDPSGDLAGYRVYRDGDLLTPVALPPSQLSYDDLGLDDDFYSYRITALDSADNESVASPWRYAYIVTPTLYFEQPIDSAATRFLEGQLNDYRDQIELERRLEGGVFERVAIFSSPGSSFFDIPPTLLEPGFNELRLRGQDLEGNRSRFSRTLVLVRHDPPAAPTELDAAIAGSDVTVDWQDGAGPGGDPDNDGYRVFRDDTALGESETPQVYDGGTHQLQASGGDPADWARVVDGDTGTGWAPDAATVAAGVSWQWTWPTPITTSRLDLRWGPIYARRFSIEVRIDGYWLWWHEQSFNFSSTFSRQLGPRIDGLRVTIPANPFDCNGCSLNEASILTRQRPATAPYLDSGVAAGGHLYEVQAVNRFDQRSARSEVVALVGTDGPEPPQNLGVAVTGCGELTASWQAPATLPAVHLGYRLYRGTGGAEPSPAAYLPPGVLEQVDGDLALGTPHTYLVTTVAELDGFVVESSPAGPASAITECAAPPPPVLLEPTVAGVPIVWPSSLADVGGRAFPGSLVTLVHDGDPVATQLLPGPVADRAPALPGYPGYDSLRLDAGERFATYMSSDEEVVVLDLETGETEIYPAVYPYEPAINADGSRVVFVDETGFALDLFMIQRPSGNLVRLTDDGDYEESPVFAPDGSVYYLAETESYDHVLRRVSPSTGAVTELFLTYVRLRSLALSPDGRWAAMASYDGPFLLDLSTGEVRQPQPNYDRMTFSATPFSPDSRRLVWARPTWNAEDAEIFVYDLETDSLDMVSPAPGEMAAVFQDDRTLAVLQVAPVAGGLRLISRSLVDGAERVLSENLFRDLLPDSDGSPFNLFTGGLGSLWLPQWQWAARLERPSGAFIFPRLELHPGVNVFEAVQEVGEDEQTSAPIEVEVLPESFGDAEVVSLAAVPGFPLAGDPVVIDAIARNAGAAPLEDLVAVLTRVSPDGIAETALVEVFDLAAGGTRRLRASWSTEGLEGDFLWRLRLDPAGLIPELDESNNDALITVPVRTSLGLDAEITRDRDVYFLGETVALSGAVTSNEAPADTEVTFLLETASDEQVAVVDVRTLPAFGPASAQLSAAWTADDVYPGTYQARLLVRRGGELDAEAVSEPFVLEARLAAELTGTADRPSYARGEVANLQARVRNSGDDTLRDLTVRLQVEPLPRGPVIDSTERALPALAVGGARTLPWAWDTSAVVPGTYGFVAVAFDAGGVELARSVPFAFVVTTAGAELLGELNVAPVLLEPSGPVAVAATVHNAGDAAITDTVLRIDIVDPATGTLHDSFEQTESLGVGATVALDWPYQPAMRALQPFVAVLSADTGAAVEQLATASFTLADLTPPELELLEPAGDLVCELNAPVRAHSVDALTSVFRVFFRLDGGSQQLPLVRESPDSEIYGSQIRIDTERTAPYVLEVVSEDVAGNATLPLLFEWSPVLDGTPPVLTVDGPADGACVAQAAWQLGAEDDNLSSLVATVDGQPYTSGEALVGDGERTLLVLAEDACGRLAEDSRTILLDQTAPALAIDGVAQGGVYAPPLDITWSISDLNLTSSSALLDGQPVSSPLRVGDPGLHTLQLSGEDCAGTVSLVSLDFEISGGGPVALDGTLGVPTAVELGELFAAGATVTNIGASDLDDVTLSLRLVDPVDSAVLEQAIAVVDLPVSASAPIDASFATAGLEARTYRVELRAAGASPTAFDLELARADVDMLAPPLELDGEIDAPDRAFVGQPLPVLGTVSNAGVDLGDVEITLRLVDTLDEAVVSSHLAVMPLGAGEAVELPHVFETSDLSPRTYRVELRASGSDAAGPFDLELARVDVDLEAGLEIPGLGPAGVVILMLLLSACGLIALRRREERESMRRHDRGAGRGTFVFFLAVLGALVALGPPAAEAQQAVPAPAEEDACDGHFPLLRQLLADGAPESAAPLKAHREAVSRELRIERALWQEELEHQRQVLGRAKAGSATERLEAVERRISADLETLESLQAGATATSATATSDAATKADVAALLGCARRSRSAISAQLAPRSPSREKRGASPAGELPEGYAAPPGEDIRAATAEAGAAPEKAGSPDPIADQVGELGADPVALYRFVLNEIRPAHYFGAVKGPEAVLRSGDGNDADQAGLLAALLRAAGFPARLAWGVQEVPLGALLDHFSAADGRGLERVLTEAGIPWSPVLQGGRAVAYRLDRVWTEVYLPYANFRGVVLDDSGATWLALDPHLKTFDGAAGTTSVLEEMGLLAGAFAAQYLAGASCTDPLEDPGACPLPINVLAAQVDAHLAGTGDHGGDYASASAPRQLAAQADEVLPAGMVGRLAGVSGFGLELPAAWQHRLRLRARDGQRTLLDVTVPATSLAGLEAFLWFEPATLDDRQVVAAYGGNLWLTPPYLVDARLELRVGEQVLASGSGSLGMGQAYELELTALTPGGDSLAFTNDQLVGVPVGLGVAAGAHGYRPPFGAASNTPEVLVELAARYLDGVADTARRLARLEGAAAVHPWPSVVSVASVVEPLGSFGLVERLDWRGVAIDADLHGVRAAAAPDAARRFLELLMLDASARERRLFEDLGMAAMSADLALILTARAGVTIHELDASNLGAILPTLPFDADVLDEIEGWVLAGGEARVPAAPLDFIAFSGVGYLLRDPLTGDSRYQLSGLLSGGMIAVPWFEVTEDVREPLRFPRTGRTNTNGDDAVAIEIFDGNLQIAVVGETLSDGEAISLKVVVSDAQDRPVKDAQVTFEVIAGGGSFGGSSSITVPSGWGGLTTADLTLGTSTEASPYYLLFPGEEWAQRVGLNLVRADVNGYGMNDLFYAFGQPDDVSELQTPNGASFEGLPHLSLGTSLRTVPADQHGNPIANLDVTFTLQGGASGEEGKGPELLSRDAKLACRPGPVVAGECSATGSVTDAGSVSGVWTWLVVGEEGPYQVMATAMDEDGGEVSTTFDASVRTASVPTGISVGWPLLLVSGRGQVRDDATGESIEAYEPGAESVPLQVSVHVIREDFTITPCGDERYCTQPEGTYTTQRLAEEPGDGCAPESCDGGTIDERVSIQFSGPGGGATVSSPDVDGLYRYAPTLPGGPGRHVYTATPTATVGVPKRPDEPQSATEIVPCGGDPPCGAEMELRDVSDDGWRTEYVLWTVSGRIAEPAPVVKLGHGNRHETETLFPYTIEPANYPALNTYVYFIENGVVPLFAQAEGVGPGAATLPVGEIFDHPEGDHEAAMAVNVGWVWSPRADQTVPLTVVSEPVPFSVVMFDVDVDSDNDNGIQEPERNDAEESIEEDGGPDGHGKFIFVNHDNDDSEIDDWIPDYADPIVEEEDNLVPLVVELRPEGGDWAGASLTFHYDGSTDDDQLPSYEGQSIGTKGIYEYFDYSAKKVGTVRLWKIEEASDARIADDYLEPGEPFTASELGFGPGEETKTFWIEGMNGANVDQALVHEQLRVELSFESESVEEIVRLTPLEPNLGLNNSNDGRLCLDSAGATERCMRPGVPDGGTFFEPDEHDELVEDQGDGFRFWIAENSLPSESTLEDLVPVMIDVPQVLIDKEYELALKLVDDSREVFLDAFPVDRSHAHILGHLFSEYIADNMLEHKLRFHNRISVSYATEREIPADEAKSALLWQVSPTRINPDATRRVRLELLYREPDDFRWQSVDSALLTVQSIDSFYSWWSSRDFDGGWFTYPTECHPDANCVPPPTILEAGFQSYGTAEHQAGTGMPDLDKKQYFVFVHGYNVNVEDAEAVARRVTQRLYWTGYRGNILAFTWHGDEYQSVITPFSPNVDNAFRTGPRFGEFIRDNVLGTWSARPEDVNVMAHSLGNQVVMDAMRLHSISPSSLMFNKLIAVEPAVWAETFWQQEPVSYTTGLPTTYTLDDLRTNSWAFWFNQAQHPARNVVNGIVHSWAPLDFALVSMRLDDALIRNPNGHVFRGSAEPDEFRVPVEMEFFDQDDLASSIGTMLKRPHRPLIYTEFDLHLPLGTADNPEAVRNIDATQYNWSRFSHSAFQGDAFPAIWTWWFNAVGDEVPTEEE